MFSCWLPSAVNRVRAEPESLWEQTDEACTHSLPLIMMHQSLHIRASSLQEGFHAEPARADGIVLLVFMHGLKSHLTDNKAGLSLQSHTWRTCLLWLTCDKASAAKPYVIISCVEASVSNRGCSSGHLQTGVHMVTMELEPETSVLLGPEVLQSTCVCSRVLSFKENKRIGLTVHN